MFSVWQELDFCMWYIQISVSVGGFNRRYSERDKIVSARANVRFTMLPFVSRGSVLLAVSPSRLVSNYRHFEISWQCTRWRSLLKAGGSRVRFLMVSLEFFFDLNPCGCNMAVTSTQPLTVMSTRNISWGVKTAGAYDWQSYHLHVRMSQAPRALWAYSRPVQGLFRLYVSRHLG